MTNLGSAHAHDDDLEMYARGRLERTHLASLESHLLDCEKCRVRLSQSIGLSLHYHLTGAARRDPKEQRSEPRFVTGDDAVVQALNPLSLERHVVRILDVSKHGMGIRTAEPLFPGTIVQIRTGTAVELGEVRHCARLGEKAYRIGLCVWPEDVIQIKG